MPFENAACIEEAYDLDVYYDPQTKHIWILAHLRPSIRQCANGRQCFYIIGDPESACHFVSADVLKQTLHRYIGVAVSRPGASADVEDPANGFNAYILADDYGDWSQLMVHNGLVLVNSRDMQTNNRLYVFRASDLMTNHSRRMAICCRGRWRCSTTVTSTASPSTGSETRRSTSNCRSR